MMKTLSILMLVAGCTGAHRDAPSDASDIDAPPTCGGEVCDRAPEAACIDGDTLRTYDATCEADTCAYPEHELECGSLGCCGDHCCAVSPSNSIEFGGLQSTGIDVEVLHGTFDTSVDCNETSVLGACSVVTRAALGEVCVCRSDKVRIGDLRVTGTRALVLFAHREVLVTGTLDVSGHDGIDGPGASYTSAPAPDKWVGGAGGSYGSRGGSAGNNVSAETAGAQTLIPLTGGMPGMASGGVGGGGGGALQITAGFRIDIVGTIEAGGGGGNTGTMTAMLVGGGGGGSGGAILLEAPTVIVGGKLLAKGGGGGGGSGTTNLGTAGWNAADIASHEVPVTEPALGGGGGMYYCNGNTPNVYGQYGGVGATAMPAGYGTYAVSTSCNGPLVYVGGGGGGGGVGRIRINSANECQCSGTVLPAATFGTVISR